RLAASVARTTEVALLRCAECWATRGRLESGAWVVSRGVNRKEEIAAVAQKYAARTLLTVALTLVDEPSTLAMDVELVRADDSSIAFAEQYRMNPETALLYRGVDRTQSRFKRLKELQDRIDQRPRFSHEIDFGTMGLSASGSLNWGALARYALTEQFGENGAGDAGIEAGGYVNTSLFSTGLVGGVLRLRLGGAAEADGGAGRNAQGGAAAAAAGEQAPHAGIAGRAATGRGHPGAGRPVRAAARRAQPRLGAGAARVGRRVRDANPLGRPP